MYFGLSWGNSLKIAIGDIHGRECLRMPLTIRKRFIS